MNSTDRRQEALTGRLSGLRARALLPLALSSLPGCGKEEPPPFAPGDFSVSFVRPAAGAVFGASFQVEVAAAWADHATLTIDGTEIGTDTQAPFQWTVGISGLANGTHTLFATAAAGDRSVDASLPVTIAPPDSGLAPEIDLLDLDGVRHTLSQYRGTRAVYIDFWASWCGPCRVELEELRTVHDTYAPRGLEILAISTGGRSGTPVDSTYAEEHAFPFPVLLDPTRSATTAYGVTGVPTQILIDPEGRIRARGLGLGSISSGDIEAILP